ncbi:MAG: outer membrane protein assembly factor BamD [Bacteroidaceae bacterium]|nr:outer membrane protein assembly factor BamD [Bacteroidaceae bacterium]
MRSRFIFLLCVLLCLSSCNEYSYLQKTSDVEYKYDAAKAYYAEGRYRRACELLSSVLASLKGTEYGEESLFLLAMANYKHKDYESAGDYFKKYYQSYPKGLYVEQARYYSGYMLYKQVPDARLDQHCTEEAIAEFQSFLDYYPQTRLKAQSQEMIAALQDKLVEKEYLSAKLYFDMGSYVNNRAGGSNYDACMVTAQNALKDFPFASAERREEFSILILRCKYQLARQSVEEKREARFRDAIDEYYAFMNDFPESKYAREAQSIFADAESIVKKKKLDISEKDD